MRTRVAFTAPGGHLFSEATWQAMERLPVIPLMQALRAIEPPS